MIKILIVSHMFPSKEFPVERSGVFVLNLIKALETQNCQIKVISPVAKPGIFRVVRPNLNWYQFNNKIKIMDNYSGIEVFYPRYLAPVILWRYLFAFLGYSMFWGIKDKFKNLINSFNPDIIHAHSLLPDTQAALLLREKYAPNIPVVSTIHGGEITYPLGIKTFNERPEKFNYPFVYKAINDTLSQSSAVISVSYAMKRLLDHYWKKEINVIYNGITKEWFQYDKYIEKKPEIIAVGALIERKRIIKLINVFSKIALKYPNWKLRVIGDGNKKQIIEKKYKKMINSKQLLMMGNIPNDLVRKYMRQASIFVLPSVREPFGVVFIEAMASFLPVIACNDGGASEIITHNKEGFLIEPDNETQLQYYTEQLINNANIRSLLGENAYKKAKKYFNWEKIGQQTVNIYKKILNN